MKILSSCGEVSGVALFTFGSLLPVENPIFDTAVVVTGLVACGVGSVDHFGLPVLFDQVLEILPICWRGIGNIMIGEPALELSLVPFVVS